MTEYFIFELGCSNSEKSVKMRSKQQTYTTYQCQAGWGGGGGAQGGILIDLFGPGVRHLNFLAVLGVGISEFLFVRVTTNYFSGREIQLYLTSQFCLGVGNLTAIFWKMSKSHPMPRLPPTGLTLIGALNQALSRSRKQGYGGRAVRLRRESCSGTRVMTSPGVIFTICRRTTS